MPSSCSEVYSAYRYWAVLKYQLLKMQPQQTPVTSSSAATAVSLLKGTRAQVKALNRDLTVTPPNILHENPTSLHVVQVTHCKHANMKTMFFFTGVHNENWSVNLLYPGFSSCMTCAKECHLHTKVLAVTVPAPRQKTAHFLTSTGSWASTACVFIILPF